MPELMQKLEYKDIEDIVKECFETAKTMLKCIPKETGLVTNRNNETFYVTPVDFYRVAEKLFSLTTAFRGDHDDFKHLKDTKSMLERLLEVRDENKDSLYKLLIGCTVESEVFKMSIGRYYDAAISLREISNEDVIVTNAKGEDMAFTLSDMNEISSDILRIVIAYWGNENDYMQLACAMSNSKVPDAQEIIHLKNTIHNYQQAINLGKKWCPEDGPILYNNIGAKENDLADLLDDEQESRLHYRNAIRNETTAIRKNKRNNSLNPNNYGHRAYAYSWLAQLSENRGERISLYKRAIVNYRRVCKLEPTDILYFELAEAKEGLAEEFYDETDKAKRLKQEAIADYRIALSIVNDSITREAIHDLKQSLQS